jgi:ATP-binding cassette subfamily B protein
VVAHRLSTIRHADRIVVLTDAGIAEQGGHEELMALNGLYAALWNAQERED